MSTTYIFEADVSVDSFEKAVRKLGFEIIKKDPQCTETEFLVSDGDNFVWVTHDDDHIQFMTRYGIQDVSFIYEIAGEMKVRIFDDMDEEFEMILHG